ncbi:MAG: efflux RND transporter periplasmic adaptor subunit [Myxococcales bacterium]|nr:MAG: efflux RND transporter periplasmic adaptor subunit [Myxococcales bacterium]
MQLHMNKRWIIAIAMATTVIAAAVLAYALWAPSKSSDEHAEHGKESEESDSEAQLYTCGMHPQVVENEPGTCPICGMNLVPMKNSTKKSPTKAGSQGDRKIKYWQAPMDPSYISDKPGKSPMGMDLIPVYEDGAGDGDPEGMIRIDPVVVQNMGVRTAPVVRGSLSRTVRTIGEVVVAEDLLSVVNLKFSGWIEKLFVDQTGVSVRQGQALFSIYSPELVSAQEEYLMAVRTAGADSPLARSAEMRLQLWDLSERDITGIREKGKPQRALTIRAPRAGYVLHKSVVQGDRALAGEDLFRIGKLSAIWIHVQVYEFDAPWVKLGQPATMELSFQRGKLYEGKVSYIYPTLDEKTRTLTVRLEFVNPELSLKPGMFTTVRIKTRQQQGVLVVPTEAIIHSGERQIVFVTPELGKYELREIVTGVAGDDHVTKVISGLHEGDQVVVSGQFLLDSESQLQEAVQKMLKARLQTKQPTSPPASKASMPETMEHAPSGETKSSADKAQAAPAAMPMKAPMKHQPSKASEPTPSTEEKPVHKPAPAAMKADHSGHSAADAEHHGMHHQVTP